MINIYNFIENKCPDAKHVFVFDPTIGRGRHILQ